jgi:hypothetical protein
MLCVTNLMLHGIEVPSPATVRVLDALRKQRNLSDYDGELVTDQALHECVLQADALCRLAKQQLQAFINKNTR